MSNLGLYQTMTTVAKKLGGPIGFVATTAIGGYIVIRTGEAGTKKIIKTVKKYIKDKKTENIGCIVVHTDGTSNEGLVFKNGDKYRVLERDKDAILIEKLGDDNNPYFVSADFLSSISEFK